MVEHLRNASSILKTALAQYLDASLAVRRKHNSSYVPDNHFDMILGELDQLESYKLTISQCKRTLGKLRNSRSSLVPVSTLPPELLSRIFYHATPMDCSASWDDDHNARPYRPPNSPEFLLHVCSYWRSVALGSHALWTHVDLAPFTSSNSELIYAGKLFVARSGESPLCVHINLVEFTPQPPSCSSWPDPLFLNFCELVAKRAKSIELDYPNSFGSKRITILEKLIANCTPGKLSRLVMNMVGDLDEFGPEWYITANDSRFEGPKGLHLPLEVSHGHFEKVFRDVTALSLDGIYPWWTSQAYHGLVKLHVSSSGDFSWPVSQLAGVLRASPQLRFFYIGTTIIEDAQPDPVCLNDLEVLEIEPEDSQYNSILRLILPGSKPLRFSTWLYGVNLPTGGLTRGEYKRFFSRSNVVQFEAAWIGDDPKATLDPCELLSISPNIKLLSLDGIDLELPLNLAISAGPPSVSQLAELRLADSVIDPTVFQWVTNTYPTLKIYIEEPTCSVRYKGKGYNGMERWKDVLTEMYPAVQFLRDVSLPNDDWE